MPQASRRCGRPGCDEVAPCPTHTPKPWASSRRRASLPTNWGSITRSVLADQPHCQLAYEGEWLTARGPARCTGTSTEVDHIGDARDHSRTNLRGVCGPCHTRRTQAQANR
ncbi:hypothetical protein GCM10009737_08180 [Nocardioides lentus]|uniref:HNH endonuclease n=1 Tax=Nocardioides lentus TaxID=338077 RepID=A0ABN2P1A2_9ACTN